MASSKTSMARFSLSKVVMSRTENTRVSRKVKVASDSSSGSDNDEEEEEEEEARDKIKLVKGRGTGVNNTDSEQLERISEFDKRNSATQEKLEGLESSGEEEGEKIKESFHNTFDERGPHRIGLVDAIQLSVVLEDLSDKLDIVGVSIDSAQVDLRSKLSQENDAMFHRPFFSVPATTDPFSQSLLKERYFLRQRYETKSSRRFRQMAGYEQGAGYREELTTVLRSHGVNRYSQKGKIYADKTQLNIILDNVCTELIQNYTFATLKDAVDLEKSNYRDMKEKFDRKIQAEKRIRETREELKRTRIEKRTVMKDFREAMMGIEDSKQEMLRRKELEYLYVKHTGEMMKFRIKKYCGKNEKESRKLLEDMKLKIRLCHEAHNSMLFIIYKKYTEAKNRLEYWMNKYELDKESLQSELDQLKANRARDLERIKWLKAFLYDYNQICKDDRRIKGIFTERDRIFRLRNRKAIKLQSWWRGEMVRKKLGPYMTPEERAKRNRKK